MIDSMGSRITRLREQAGMSQSDLARRLHISRASVQSWECGAKYPSTDKLISLAKIFHVSTDYLLEIDAVKTVNLDTYTIDEQRLIFQMLQYFDGTASSVYKENE